VKKTLVEEYKTINPEDVGLYTVVDTAQEAFEILKNSKERKYF